MTSRPDAQSPITDLEAAIERVGEMAVEWRKKAERFEAALVVIAASDKHSGASLRDRVAAELARKALAGQP